MHSKPPLLTSRDQGRAFQTPHAFTPLCLKMPFCLKNCDSVLVGHAHRHVAFILFLVAARWLGFCGVFCFFCCIRHSVLFSGNQDRLYTNVTPNTISVRKSTARAVNLQTTDCLQLQLCKQACTHTGKERKVVLMLSQIMMVISRRNTLCQSTMLKMADHQLRNRGKMWVKQKQTQTAVAKQQQKQNYNFPKMLVSFRQLTC